MLVAVQTSWPPILMMIFCLRCGVQPQVLAWTGSIGVEPYGVTKALDAALVRGTTGQRLRPGGRIVGQRPQARERVAVEADHDRLRGRRPRPTQPEQPLQAALLLEAEPICGADSSTPVAATRAAIATTRRPPRSGIPDPRCSRLPGP